MPPLALLPPNLLHIPPTHPPRPAPRPRPRPRRAAQASPEPRLWGDKERALVLQMLVHLADLANPARPFFLASAWAERVVTEFLKQGDKEAARGLGVSPFCDRQKVCMPAAQQGFVKMFAGVSGAPAAGRWESKGLGRGLGRRGGQQGALTGLARCDWLDGSSPGWWGARLWNLCKEEPVRREEHV